MNMRGKKAGDNGEVVLGDRTNTRKANNVKEKKIIKKMSSHCKMSKENKSVPRKTSSPGNILKYTVKFEKPLDEVTNKMPLCESTRILHDEKSISFLKPCNSVLSDENIIGEEIPLKPKKIVNTMKRSSDENCINDVVPMEPKKVIIIQKGPTDENINADKIPMKTKRAFNAMKRSLDQNINNEEISINPKKILNTKKRYSDKYINDKEILLKPKRVINTMKRTPDEDINNEEIPLKPKKVMIAKKRSTDENVNNEESSMKPKKVIITKKRPTVENINNEEIPMKSKKVIITKKRPANGKINGEEIPMKPKRVSITKKKPSDENINSEEISLKPKRVINTKKRQTFKKAKNKVIKSKSDIPTDFFGFNSSASCSDVEPCETELTEFDPSKPFRVALYVRPSTRLRLNGTLVQKCLSLNPNLSTLSAANSTTMLSSFAVPRAFLSPKRRQFKVPMSSTPYNKPKTKLVQRTITESMRASPKRTRAANETKEYKSFFEISDPKDKEMCLLSDTVKSPVSDPVTDGKPTKGYDYVNDKMECSFKTSSEEEKTTSDDDVSQTACFRKPNRRSYVKRPRRIEPTIEEESSDEILESIEKKSKKKLKSKKAQAKDDEFEMWSRSMNSQFNEVDKFEISFD